MLISMSIYCNKKICGLVGLSLLICYNKIDPERTGKEQTSFFQDNPFVNQAMISKWRLR